ncbi:hypothetical protein F5X99DRAFT_403524 [Biscogniauxia marginata]|nr:hypothetical protein F5X99DRAFT_403524 [Biscogniauxia marginata]
MYKVWPRICLLSLSGYLVIVNSRCNPNYKITNPGFSYIHSSIPNLLSFRDTAIHDRRMLPVLRISREYLC